MRIVNRLWSSASDLNVRAYPAVMMYAPTVGSNGGEVAVFNLDSNSDKDADFLFLSPCEETLPAALGVWIDAFQ
jgi:hypothetical protein